MKPRIKDDMSSFDIGAIVGEISLLLQDRLVENIYMLDFKVLIFSFQGLQEKLLIEAGRRLHLTAYKQDIPRAPASFCQALRKYLRRTRLKETLQIDFDRIVKFDFSSTKGEFSLFSELFGRGNHILVDGEQRILQALSYRRMKARDVMRGEILRLPSSSRKNILEAQCSDLEVLLGMNDPLARQLTMIFNIGRFLAEEIALRAGFKGSIGCNQLDDDDVGKIYDAIQSIIVSYHSQQPHIVLNEDGKYADVLNFRAKSYDGYKTLCFSSFSKAADEYYMDVGTRKYVSEVSIQFNEQLDKQKRILTEQKNQLEIFEKSIKENKKIGDVIYANSFTLQKTMNKITSTKESRGHSQNIIKELNNGLGKFTIVSVNTNGASAILEHEGTRFELDLRKNIYKNASDFYDQSKSSKAKLVGLRKAIEQTQIRMENVFSAEPKMTDDRIKPVKIRKKAWYEKFHWFTSSEGFLVLGGRDATTNEILIKRYTDSEDVVLHADIPGSPFGIIKSDSEAFTEATIREAAQMVASYSKAWKSGVSAIDVYWVRPEQVKKTPPSGEYLARGSFMIYGSRNYLKNVPLRVAIGVKVTPEKLIIIGGPPSAISAQTKILVEIVIGRIKTGKLIKSIVSKLIYMAPDKIKSEIKRIPLEEFQVFIPGGRGELAKN